ncbi:MAG: MarR family transcriptional regulator [Alphaproteobacteria bacterium]|nr:MarR family transcriptional regulator [Alphaproteobacteria bacterium]
MKTRDSHTTQKDSFDNYQLFLIYSTLRLLLNMYGKLVRRFDLTYTQYLVLSLLHNEKETLMSVISEKISLDSGTLTPVLKTLEAKKLLKKKPPIADKRQRLLCLTETGSALVSQVNAEIHPFIAEFQLKETEVNVLENMLGTIKKKDKCIELYLQKQKKE